MFHAQNPPTGSERYLTIQEVADSLGVDSKTIRRQIGYGILPAVRVGLRNSQSVRDVRAIRIPASAVAAILEPMGGEVA